MKQYHSADRELRPHFTEGHYFFQPAFQRDWRSSQPRASDALTSNHLKAQELDLAYIRSVRNSASMDVLYHRFVSDIHGEVASEFYVSRRVFALTLPKTNVDADHWRLRRYKRKATKWR